MSKFTEAELKDKCLAWGNYYIDLVASVKGWKISSEDFDKWWDVYNKPAKKIIDLEPLIASGIDCEFKDAEYDTWRVIGPLSCTFSTVKSPYQRKTSTVAWEQCRPRMNHKMLYNGEKPIEGFVVRVYFGPCSSAILTGYVGDSYGPHVRAIEFLEIEDGYAYPWEQTE